MIRTLCQLNLMAAVIIVSFPAQSVFAQGNTFNPYGNSGYADYREFTTPMYSNDPSLPGQARLQNGALLGRNRANQFDSYVNSLDGSSADQLNANRGLSTGVPYYKAYQLYDKENKRAYRPNDTAADRLFRARANERNAAYSKALEETDPRKRAVLLQRLDQDTVNRPLGSITDQSAAASRKTSKSAPARTPTDSTNRRIPSSAAAARATPTTPSSATRAATPSTPPASATTPAPAPVSPSTIPIPAPR